MCLKAGDSVVVKIKISNDWIYSYYGIVKGIICYYDKTMIAVTTEENRPFYAIEDIGIVYRTVVLCA